MKVKEKQWWFFSLISSMAMVAVLVILWSVMNHYTVESNQLVNETAVTRYLNAHFNSESPSSTEENPLLTVKTGVFIQSIKFFDSSEVNLSGYIWQHYEIGLHDEILPAKGEAGFVLPEQVDSGSTIAPKEVYRFIKNQRETIGWYFEATLRQPFQYDQYPFDHKTVWLRMWHKDFSRNVVLVPDFDAYVKTGKDDIFGIEKSIVLGTWRRQNTYFSYKRKSYDTNFGITDYIGQKEFPELHYNFVIKRKFENAFIVHLLPLFLVAALLFAALLTITGDSEMAGKHGFNTSGVISACSALFFVVLLAHIQLREQFASSGIVYIETFYFLMYAILVVAAANTYLFCMKSVPWLQIIHYKENLIPKVFFWPVVLGGMIVLTIVHIFF